MTSSTVTLTPLIAKGPAADSSGVHTDQEVAGKVVLLHSIGLDGRSFAWLRGAVPDRWQMMTVDMRGHGDAVSLSGATPFHAYVDDVIAAIDRQCGAGTLHLLGHSMGGAIAAAVAARCAQIASLAVIASPPKGFPAFAERATAVRSAGMASAVAPTLERWFGDAPDIDSPAYRYASDTLARLTADAFAGAWDALAGFSGYGALVATLPPTLLLIGGADLSTPPNVMAPIEAAFRTQGRGAQVASAIVPEAGHMMPLTHASTIAPLLERHWAANGQVA